MKSTSFRKGIYLINPGFVKIDISMGSTMILMMEGDNYTEAKHCPGFSVACPGKKLSQYHLKTVFYLLQLLEREKVEWCHLTSKHIVVLPLAGTLLFHWHR